MIALVDVREDLRRALARMPRPTLELGSTKALAASASAEALDVVVLGAAVKDPVQGASQAYRIDPALSVVILGADPAQCARIRSALVYAPLIGNDVACAGVDDADVIATIEGAASRTRARRRHRHTVAALEPKLAAAPPRSHLVRDRYAAHLMDLAPFGILAVDADARIVTANAEAARLLGASERELLGLPLGAQRFGNDEDPWAPILAQAREEPSPPARFSCKTAGAPQFFEARAVLVTGQPGGGYLVVFEDVTARVEEGAVKQRAFEQAEEASRLKDEFIAVISHELRTPLNAIVGWTRLLRAGKVSPEKLSQVLETIERNANAQAVLIEDLLDVSRIVSGKMRLDVAPTDLAKVVALAIETVTPAASAKGVRIDRAVAPALPRIAGDAQRLQQVVWNLLSNAVKFTPRGGVVTVTAGQEDSSVALTVRDDGAGIPPEALPFVFDPFRQAEGGTTRAYGGLGLGLSIVRRLVELHGGTVTAESAGRGAGARFVVRLPIAPLTVRAEDTRDVRAAGAVSVARTEPSASLAGAVVLVVDDEEDARDLVATLLALSGATTLSAASVREAKRLLETRRPDLVVSDIGMSPEDGFALIAHLRGRFGPTLPAIALTAYATRADRAKVLAAGFDAHAAKPVLPEVLVETAAGLLRRGG